MRISSQAKAFVRKAGLEMGIATTYLFARLKGFPLHYFPEGYEVLDDIPMSYIENEKVSAEWVKQWMKKWPTPSTIWEEDGVKMPYSISGNGPEVKKRFGQFSI